MNAFNTCGESYVYSVINEERYTRWLGDFVQLLGDLD